MTKTQTDADRRNTVLQASTLTQMNVRIFGNVAIVIGTNLETSRYGGQDTSGQYRWTDVFARRNGRWQVVSAQSTRVE
jgi:ketosteroid isomerase-like protein